MLYSQNKLEAMASRVLRGEEISLDDNAIADYADSKVAVSRIEVSENRNIKEVPYIQYDNNEGVMIRSWKAEDYKEEDAELSLDAPFVRINAQGVVVESRIIAFESNIYPKVDYSVDNSYLAIQPLEWDGEYHPMADNKVEAQKRRVESFSISREWEQKPQWSMYLYKNDYIPMAIRLERLAAEYKERQAIKDAKKNNKRKAQNAIRKLRKRALKGYFRWSCA